jgi:cellulose synthase (UDP-forming)
MMLGLFTLVLAALLAGPAYLYFRRQANRRLGRQDDHA